MEAKRHGGRGDRAAASGRIETAPRGMYAMGDQSKNVQGAASDKERIAREYPQVIELQKIAINLVTIANGGAIIAILSLIGNVFGKSIPAESIIDMHKIKLAVACFAAGMFLGVLASVLALFWAHMRTRTLPSWEWAKHAWQWAADTLPPFYPIVLLLSVIAFCAGSWIAASALAHESNDSALDIASICNGLAAFFAIIAAGAWFKAARAPLPWPYISGLGRSDIAPAANPSEVQASMETNEGARRGAHWNRWAAILTGVASLLQAAGLVGAGLH